MFFLFSGLRGENLLPRVFTTRRYAYFWQINFAGFMIFGIMQEGINHRWENRKIDKFHAGNERLE